YMSDAIAGVHERVDRATTRAGVPTLPRYDSTNFPDDAVYGQIVRDVNDFSALYIYGEDDHWHKVGGGIDYLRLAGTGQNLPTGFFDRGRYDVSSIKTNNVDLW